MRIGLMLRSLDEKGGIGVYTRFLTQTLLNLDRDNEYFLYYRDESAIGRFGHHPNVTERVVKARSKAVWDQIRIPLACRRDKLDAVFHLKFTVPILAPCATAMVLHGAGWFVPEYKHFWSRLDLAYVRTMMPVYCRRASAIISVSHTTTDTFHRAIRIPQGKIRTIYHGCGEHFTPTQDPGEVAAVRDKYGLPESYILTVTGYDRGDRKNFGGILRAFELLHGKTNHKLVVAGRDCHKFREDYSIPDSGYGKDILFPGWIEQHELPVFYSQADLFVFPSKLEGFGIPVIESLACGTPVLTSQDPALCEVAGNAGLSVDADNPEAIATAMASVLLDPDLRQSLSDRALERAQAFSWEKCARETLNVLEGLTQTSNKAP